MGLDSTERAFGVFCLMSRALFTRLASTESGKINFKTVSYDIIHTFKKKFTTVFSVFSFQQ